jgi:NAD(P)-dependent dehydrogenase (short-subunit alcohol dehydrogenase family)
MPDDLDSFSSIMKLELGSFGHKLNVAVIGASGGIGASVANELEEIGSVSKVLRFSRSDQLGESRKSACLHLDLEDEVSIAEAANRAKALAGELAIVFVATGALYDGKHLQPEKTWRTLSPNAMEIAFRLNATGPALVAKYFLPLLAKGRKAAFAALSARVGSIADNHLGGWYAYRASKAALNMVIKTLSIELSRQNPNAICVGLHPGTVDTNLSKPFQKGVRENKLFTPTQSARHLLSVLDNLSPVDSGGLYAWDGSQIPF